MIDNSDDAHIQSPHGREFEGLTHEGRRLELWVDDPEIGEPAFRWFESDASRYEVTCNSVPVPALSGRLLMVAAMKEAIA